MNNRTDKLTPENDAKTQVLQKTSIKIPKEQERSKVAAVLVTPESNKHKERKQLSIPHESSAMQRLEKFRKITSPLPKQHAVRPQG